MHRRSRGIALVAALALVAAACGGDDDEGAAGTTAAETAASEAPAPDSTAAGDTGAATTSAPEAAADPNGVLRVGVNFFRNQSMSLDPTLLVTSDHDHYYYQLYAALAQLDPETQEYTPYLAESWEIIDPQTVKFVIRADAVFHDGRPVTAADAKFTYETGKANKAAGTANTNIGINLLESVEVVDEKTFIVHMSEPALLTVFELMAGPEFMIIPADAGAEQGTNPIGNGPFKFKSLDPGQKVVLEKADNFFEADRIKLAGIEYINLVEGNAQLNALLAGDIDVAVRLDLSSVETLESSDGFEPKPLVGPVDFIFVNWCKAPGHVWENELVRQAAYHATDRKKLADAVYGGYGAPLSQFYPAGHPYHDPALEEIYPYDPDKARELLQQAGVESIDDGIWTTSAIPEGEDTSLYLQQMWGDVGINLEVLATDDLVGDALAPSTAQPPTLERGDSILITNTSAGLLRARRLFEPHITNTCTFNSPEASELMGQINALAPDDPQAVELWHQLSRVILEDTPFMILAQSPVFSGYSSDRVGGISDTDFRPVTSGSFLYDNWYINA